MYFNINIILVTLLLSYILSAVDDIEALISAKIRDNKIIAIYTGIRSYKTYIRVYELKEGAISDINNARKTFDFGHIDYQYNLKFLDVPDNLQDNNRVWLKFENREYSYPSIPPFMNWVGHINLNNMSLENDSDFIKFPTDEKFPLRGYTINTISNELGSALYIAGGQIYSKKEKRYQTTNSFYKYNFTSKEWKDMTYSINGRLKTLSDHRSAVVDNRYLVLLGGGREVAHDPKPDRWAYELDSLYNLTIFDTLNNNLENISIKPDISESHLTTVKFGQFLATAHKNIIYVLGGSMNENQSNESISNVHLGIFDFKHRKWDWTPIFNEDGSNFKGFTNVGDIHVLNDQLIICTGIEDGTSNLPILVYDIPSHRMKSVLRLTNSSNDTSPTNEKNEVQNQSKELPTYAIVLIAISCTVLLSALVYIFYHKNNNKPGSKNGKTKNNGPIREVWANPDIDSTYNIISWDKSKGLNIKKKSSNSLKSNGPGSNTSSSYKSDLIEFNNTFK